MKKKLLIIGCGDVVSRIIPQLVKKWKVVALVRQKNNMLAYHGVKQIIGDLDCRGTLGRLAGIFDSVIHSVPPASNDAACLKDRRTKNLLSIISQKCHRPKKIVYIGTTGVYGDCQGAWVSESSALQPATGRALRRADAEKQIKTLGVDHVTNWTTIRLRSPGIYSKEHLPTTIDQAMHSWEDSYSNHIHADDLAQAVLVSLFRGRPNRVYHVVDCEPLLVGNWFENVARFLNQPLPKRVSKDQLKASISPMRWSFLSESRRLCNDRLRKELKLHLKYPTTSVFFGQNGQYSVSNRSMNDDNP